MKLRGQIAISRPSGDGFEPHISIQLTDWDSWTRFVEVRIPLAEFAQAVTGLVVECELEVSGLDLVGKIREHKKERVFIPTGPWSSREERAREAVKALEAEGWRGHVRDTLNHHNLVEHTEAGQIYIVSFERWVEREETDGNQTDKNRS